MNFKTEDRTASYILVSVESFLSLDEQLINTHDYRVELQLKAKINKNGR